MSNVASVIGFFIALGKLAFVGFVAYFLCPFLQMPENAKRICQGIVVALCILAGLSMVLAGEVPHVDRSLSMDRVPNIMVPEKR
jgi:hypothetical protein